MSTDGTFMTYTYLTQKPWMARFRSHEISLAFDKAIRDMGGDIWYNTEVTKIDVKNGAVRGVELADGTYIPCERVISNLMPTVVFDRMIDKSEVPERERNLMNARKLAQSAFTVYLGLDIPYEQLGFKAYDTFVRSTGDTLSQYESAATIEGHKDYCVTIINEAIPDCTPEGTCMVQFAKFYKEDAFANVTEEEYFKLKDRIAEECVTHFEKLTGKPDAALSHGADGHKGSLPLPQRSVRLVSFQACFRRGVYPRRGGRAQGGGQEIRLDTPLLHVSAQRYRAGSFHIF